jgi:hypothetical protein
LTSVNPGHNDLDEQIPANDGMSKEERREYFRHPLRRPSNGGAGMKELRMIRKGFLKNLKMARTAMPQVFG